jgi:SNF2 family DNA or RNA helicase
VFCQWEDLKKKVASALGELGVNHCQLLGNVYQRGEVIRRFQEERGEGAVGVLLLSLEHSASGTNLTAANHVVFVHPMHALSAERAVSYEAQAIGRVRRWGQERPEVHCWRFVTRGTVEETITAEHRRDLWEVHLRGADVEARCVEAAGAL